ncbi:alpha-1,3-mannosyl-glycoprotein 4-beta-N-acetylglucosaminyltransferase B isoform X1 [Gadus morhua]|uniref:alpha-1,3-mannosyl-glycoprotein 4-beta-N-acetylglucosaminyltransferase B isoform X1 n=1 Tax=Gadus morhua TaxID=8049 RepID=UPI0011B502AC|nr:alpha-1,3-mannosyl-glycoprotein 4-beta-N-acetylglucosaminyltransferase B-like isoform X1 [Gadus morhua]
MKFRPVQLVFLLPLGFLFSFTWINSIPKQTDSYEEIQSLYKRLLKAEAAGVQVNLELQRALERLANFSTTKVPSTASGQPRQELASSDLPNTLPLPNIFSYLPHLKEHVDGLAPNIVLGQGRRGVSLVLGVPTVRREKQSYLINTLSSLLFGLTPSQCADLLIIIFVAETDVEYVQTVADLLIKSFPAEASSGLLEVVSPSRSFYPDFTTLHETLGDSKERVKWRTKQTLDFSYLMLYAQDKGKYYVQLEDDIVATTDYYGMMQRYALQQEAEPWLFLEFSQLGFIGKMFHTQDLTMIVEFFLMFHKDKPIDWLLDHILWVKVCNPERDEKHCNAQKSLIRRRHKPSLFQHVGLQSSLSGKVQSLKDKDFSKQDLFRAHSNPLAQVSTSLAHYKTHTLGGLYLGQGFFWGLTPVRGDHVTIRLAQPAHVKRYLFRSGSFESHLDKFYNTTVEVLPRNASVSTEVSVGSPPQYIGSDGFIVIGDFQAGVAEGLVDEALQPVSALRLMVNADSDAWVLLSEVRCSPVLSLFLALLRANRLLSSSCSLKFDDR